MIVRFKDFDVEALNDGRGTIFFPCGHSLMGDKFSQEDMQHKCGVSDGT